MYYYLNLGLTITVLVFGREHGRFKRALGNIEGASREHEVGMNVCNKYIFSLQRLVEALTL